MKKEVIYAILLATLFSNQLKKCLQEMAEDSYKSVVDLAEWTQAIDRGGLIHVNDNIFSVFAEMEVEIW